MDVLVDGSRTSRTPPRTEGNLVAAAIPGGAFALRWPETIEIVAGSISGEIVRPTHLGALLLKSRAAAQDKSDRRERHLTDLAVLYATISDPGAIAEKMNPKYRKELRRVTPAFDELGSENRTPAESAYYFLCEPT